MKVRAFITHKKAEHYSDCQDRFSVSEDGMVIALSDGMTSTTPYPDIWAELLTKAYVNSKGDWNNDVLTVAKKDWTAAVYRKLEERRAKGDRNLWRLENNIAMRKSAGATLCGICIDSDAKWIGHIIGDSTIIECKNYNIERICSSEDKAFDNYPDYLDSISEGRGEIKEFNGSLDEETFLLLVSDPFSEFLDKHKEDSTKYLKDILALESHNDFIKLVEDWRFLGMHNDDSTLIIIQYNEENDIEEDDIENLIKEEKEGIDSFQTIVVESSNEKQPIIEEREEKKTLKEASKNTSGCSVESLLNNIINAICSVLGSRNKKFKDKIRKKIKELLENFLKEYDYTSRPS